MATVTKFEELEIWQQARILSNVIFALTLREPFCKDFKLRDQINEASGSVMDNIAEGFERGSRLEFVNFLGYSKGSCGEVKSQLYRAIDRDYISKPEFNQCYEMSNRIAAGISKLIEYLNKTNVRGLKFKDRI